MNGFVFVMAIVVGIGDPAAGAANAASPPNGTAFSSLTEFGGPTVFSTLAPPNVFGYWTPLKGHLSAVTYTVAYRVHGTTAVVGEVWYIDAFGKEVKSQFNGSITFRTGNCIGQPMVRFKGVPLGSAVTVIVSP